MHVWDGSIDEMTPLYKKCLDPWEMGDAVLCGRAVSISNNTRK